jgi:hypothetical protein
MTDRIIRRSAQLATPLACFQKLTRGPFARIGSTVDVPRSNNKEHASSIAVNRLPLGQPNANAELWDFLGYPPLHICRAWFNGRYQIYPILQIKTLLFMWWQSEILYISLGSRINLQKGSYSCSATRKRRPEKLRHKIDQVSQNSLKIETARQPLCEI